LRGVTFDWDNDAFEEKEDTKKPNFTERATGVIAQDVEKVLPEAVHENKDGFKNVAYGNMVGLLIEAIKEQQEQIDALKAQLNG
jgi:putative lipoic acid-binding regulatory protein